MLMLMQTHLQFQLDNCVDDVVDVLEAIAHDLRHGGNAKTYDANYYVGTTHVMGKKQKPLQSLIMQEILQLKQCVVFPSAWISYRSAYLATLKINSNLILFSLQNQILLLIVVLKRKDALMLHLQLPL